MIGTAAVVCEIDCLTATVHDIAEVRSQFSSTITTNSRLCGFGGWFDVHFRVSRYSSAFEFYIFEMSVICMIVLNSFYLLLLTILSLFG